MYSLRWRVPFLGLLCLIFLVNPIKSQTLSGQWIGSFTSANDPSGNKTDYVLEFDVIGNEIIGYSYTYFAMAGKRYYVICKLRGSYDKGSKSIKVSETEHVKTNTPPDFQNCLQTHLLTYFKQNEKEILLGKWSPTVKGSTCGSGTTEVERKTISGFTAQQPSIAKKTNEQKSNIPASTSQQKVSSTGSNNDPKSNNTITQDQTTKNKAEQQPNTAITKSSQETISNESNDPKQTTPILPIDGGKARPLNEKELAKLNKRSLQVIQTIEFTGSSIKVDIYDNGQVDGDVISIYVNDKVVLPPKMLTAEPISLVINAQENQEYYDLIMYAESMGKIPPNTALMIVTTSTNRFEINITSTEQSSGVVRFKPKR
ncbi:MAG: hypothetical protein ACK5AO_03845 [bacterium]